MCFPGFWIKKKSVFFRGTVCLPGWLKTPGKSSISHQTCADRLESCITWWFMFERSLNQNRSWFWHFGILRMSFPNVRKVWSIVYRWPRYFGLSGQNPRETSKMLQTCAERLESCITMWYMIPSNPRNFEPEIELILTFWNFEDVISKWPKSLNYSIPLTKILWPQSRSSISMW